YKRHRSAFSSFEEFINWYNDRPHGSLNFQSLETPEMAFKRKCPLKPILLSVIDCSGCEGYMNKLDYIKLGRARNNFRTPQSLSYEIISKNDPLLLLLTLYSLACINPFR
ncbi:MAG: hypothetical protein ACP5PV_07175, partial [Methanothrix sp.]